MWSRFKTFDPWLYGIPLVLMIISVVAIYALTYADVGTSLALRQGIYALIGVGLMFLLTFVDYRVFRSWRWWLYGFGVVSLILVRFFGIDDFGARRWINIGFFQFQPGELDKLIIVIFLAVILGQVSVRLRWRQFILAGILLLIPLILILMQPDLGTAIVVLAGGLTVIWYSKLTANQKKALIAILLVGGLVFSLAVKNTPPFGKLLKDYQRERLVSFVDPSGDKSGSGYNVLQSVIAVGSGGLTGKGLGLGSQSQLNFLPVAHADFIFAGIAEAWGLIGSLLILGLYSLLLIRILLAARIAKDDFGMLICLGIAAKILIEMLVNVGMNMRLMPVTGIPLPFLSYGGTTMLTNALCLGIVQSIVMRYKRLTF